MLSSKGADQLSRLNQKYEEWESLQFLTFFTGTVQAKILLKLAPLAYSSNHHSKSNDDAKISSSLGSNDISSSSASYLHLA